MGVLGVGPLVWVKLEPMDENLKTKKEGQLDIYRWSVFRGSFQGLLTILRQNKTLSNNNQLSYWFWAYYLDEDLRTSLVSGKI